MPHEVRLWQIGDADRLIECAAAPLNLESRLEDWLAQDISVISADLMVIGRQVETAYGGVIDLLCIDRSGDLVIVELKRDKTSREITSQTLDYASWVSDLSGDTVTQIAGGYLGNGLSLDDAFKHHFGEELPENVNEDHRMLIVASRIDASSERIIKYLSNNHGVSINAVTFHYFKTGDGKEFVARVFLIDPVEVEYQARTKGASKRRRNLTYEELQQQAEQNSVGDLYSRLVSGLEQHLQKHTTRSSFGFAVMLDNSRKTVFSLIPGKSDQKNGLRYQIYKLRFAQLFSLSQEQVQAMLPRCREPWQYAGSASPDYSGYEGYFANVSEVDRFLQGVTQREVVA